MPKVRITIAVATVLQAFLQDTTQPRYGYDLMQATSYPSGKLYPILARLQAAGWLTKTKEDIDPTTEGRPARRLYQLTPTGIQAARYELAVLAEQFRRLPAAPPPSGSLRPQEGPA